MAHQTSFSPSALAALVLGVTLAGSCSGLTRTAADALGDRAAPSFSRPHKLVENLDLEGADPGAGGGNPDSPEAREASAATDMLVRLAAAADAVSDGDPRLALLLLEGVADGAHGGVAPFLRGVANLRLGNLDSARQQLEVALELDPDDVPTLSVLARVHYESQHLPEAVATLEHAVSLEPDDAPSLASLGLLLLEQGRMVASFERLKRSVEIDPEQVEAHRGLAMLFTAVSDAERAEQAWRRALELSPDDTSLLTGLGHVLRDQQRPRAAAAVYARAAAREPQEPHHAANLGAAWLEAGEPSRARGEFERALLMPGLEQADAVYLHFNLAGVLEQLGDTDGAVDEYEVALQLDQELGPVHEALGLICLDAGDLDRARRHLEQALLNGGLAPASLAELALLYDAEGQTAGTQECLALLRVAAEQELAEDPEVAFRLAQVMVRSADPAVHDAAAAIDLLIDLVRGDAREQAWHQGRGATWNLLAEALAIEERFDEALQAMDRALGDAGPGDPRRPIYAATRERYRLAVELAVGDR